MGDVQGDLAKDMQARGRNPYGTHLRNVLNACKQCGGSGRFVIPPLPGHTEPQVDEDCARCEGSGKESDARFLERARRRRATDAWLGQEVRHFPMEQMNDQQRDLHSLIENARLDLEAGRPAERTHYALLSALRAVNYTDMTDGTADDQGWRERRGAA